jgi:hypothetical protein
MTQHATNGNPGPSAGALVRCIERLTRLARQARTLPLQPGGPDLQLFEPAPKTKGRDEPRQAGRQNAAQAGWWVLAQGGVLDPEDFAAREAVREELLAAVRASGVLAGENVWVWDETGRAQLVLATLPTRERAQRVAERLREKGLNVVVRREMP